MDPSSDVYMYWLIVITLAVVYNTWTVPLRSVFSVDTPEIMPMWITFDVMFATLLQSFVEFSTHAIDAMSCTCWTFSLVFVQVKVHSF